MLNNENFKEILSKSEIALILISGEGCANCYSMYPLVSNIKNTRNDVDVFMVEVDEKNYDINTYYNVEVVPTILMTNYGKLVAKIKGYQPEEIFNLYVESKIEEIHKSK